ncbi:MAG: TIGR02281 family clan AA aspartic protease [Gammaproteobacteria bacterium]|nr:TIGR02281 family clan AA aspartic protease [Gammaproteobacteria bacterium]
MKRNLITLFLTYFLSVAPLQAVETIQVMALFNNKAMVKINGQNRLLKVGQTSPEGVTLLSANASRVELEVDGERGIYELGHQVAGSYAKPAFKEVRLYRSPNGSYATEGSINGQNTHMLVDTGATSVAMSEQEAKRLGIRYRMKGERASVRTASGIANAYAVMLDRVRVGSITLHQVQAVVIEGSYPQEVLLGMSFLSRVEMDTQANTMVLRSKF